MLLNLKKAVFIALSALFLLSGTGLDQFALKTVQSQQTEETVETELDEAIEIRRQTLQSTKSRQTVGRSKISRYAVAEKLAFSISHPPLPTSRHILFRSLLI